MAFVTTSKRGRHAIGLRCPRCPRDGRDFRDFRGFVNNSSFVEPFLERIAATAEVDRRSVHPPPA